MYQIQLKWLHISTLFIQCIIRLGMRGYINCAHINVCTHPRIVCVRIYAHSMRILCAYMRAYFAHTFAHTLRIYARILCTHTLRILCAYMRAYFAHICAHSMRIYARIFNFFLADTDAYLADGYRRYARIFGMRGNPIHVSDYPWEATWLQSSSNI